MVFDGQGFVMNSMHMVKVIDEEYNEKLTNTPVLKGLPLRLPSGQLSSRRNTAKPNRLSTFIPPPNQYSDSSSSQRFESSNDSKPKASARRKKQVEEKKVVNKSPLMKKPTL